MIENSKKISFFCFILHFYSLVVNNKPILHFTWLVSPVPRVQQKHEKFHIQFSMMCLQSSVCQQELKIFSHSHCHRNEIAFLNARFILHTMPTNWYKLVLISQQTCTSQQKNVAIPVFSFHFFSYCCLFHSLVACRELYGWLADIFHKLDL